MNKWYQTDVVYCTCLKTTYVQSTIQKLKLVTNKYLKKKIIYHKEVLNNKKFTALATTEYFNDWNLIFLNCFINTFNTG